jgi:adenine deaminase
MRVLDATVTRRTRSGDILGPHQRVDVMTALKAMTIWPAYQYFEEKNKGSIETGKLADFVILDKDPTAIDPETLDAIKVTQTIKEGNTVYLAGEKQGAHLSLPNERGEHAFSNFIRQVADESHRGQDQGGADTQFHCCGCKVAAMLGDALASSGN